MDNDDSAVGYGKPPREFRFKPGQSGNPHGRPKGSSLKADLRAALSMAVPGSPTTTKQRALVEKLVDEASAGNLNAIKLLFSLGSTLLKDEPVSDFVDPDEQQLIEAFEGRPTAKTTSGGSSDGDQ